MLLLMTRSLGVILDAPVRFLLRCSCERRRSAAHRERHASDRAPAPRAPASGRSRNWRRLQAAHECFFFVADWHALTTDYDRTESVERERRRDGASTGSPPASIPSAATIFVQSAVPEHAELHLLLVDDHAASGGSSACRPTRRSSSSSRTATSRPTASSATPSCRRPTSSCTAPTGVPGRHRSGAARRAHARDRAPLQHLYRRDLPRAASAARRETPRVPGLDGRKMSKSYNNAVFLADSAEEVKAKLSRMMTDPRRARRTDPGDPDDCPAYNAPPDLLHAGGARATRRTAAARRRSAASSASRS